MIVLYIVVAVVVAALVLNALGRRRTDELRQTGRYPPPGQGSDDDVERLVALGRKIDAIKLYREIHRSDLKTAKDAVDKMAEKPGLGSTR
jgi:ribosomal protein L7/L12